MTLRNTAFGAPRALGAGFTLIEMTVCAAVVFLLASILLPAAYAARARAGDLSCRHNLRQAGLAFFLYAERFGGFLPHEDDGDTLPPFGCGWTRALLPFAGDDRIFSCPTAAVDPEARSYKMNSLLETADRHFFPLARVPNPAATVLLFDGRVDNPGVRRLPKGTWSVAANRHPGGTNLLFLDGHVEGFLPPGLVWEGPGPFRWRVD